MGGIQEYISSIFEHQNIFKDAAQESIKHDLAHKIHDGIYQTEKDEALKITKSLDLDVKQWLAKNESYVNLSTALQNRNRINKIQERRRNVEKSNEFVEPEKETEA